jgi:hypothetical protein
MKVQIVKNKYLNALFLLMILSSIIHIAIVIFMAIKNSDLYYINFFNIIGVNCIIPNFLNNFVGNLISLGFTILLYLIIFLNNTSKKEIR